MWATGSEGPVLDVSMCQEKERRGDGIDETLRSSEARLPRVSADDKGSRPVFFLSPCSRIRQNIS